MDRRTKVGTLCPSRRSRPIAGAVQDDGRHKCNTARPQFIDSDDERDLLTDSACVQPICRYEDVRSRKEQIKLDLNPPPLPDCFQSMLQVEESNAFLASPEIDMFELESPELEKMLLCPAHDSDEVEGYHDDSSRGNLDSEGNFDTHQGMLHVKNVFSGDELEYVSSNVDSPAISDLHFITVTNNGLKDMLPAREYEEFDSNDADNSTDYPIGNVEQLQCVPDCTYDRENNCIQRSFNFKHLFRAANNNFQTQEQGETYRFVKVEPQETTDTNAQNFYQIIEEHVANQKRVQAQREHEINRALLNKYLQETTMSRQSLYRRNASSKEESHSGARHISWVDSQEGSLPPIDLEVQEIVKRERKKLKNRVAASKCRKKKLEREAQLEIRVNQLKEQNTKMATIALALRQQVSELRQQVLEHMQAGCPIALMQSSQSFYSMS